MKFESAVLFLPCKDSLYLGEDGALVAGFEFLFNSSSWFVVTLGVLFPSTMIMSFTFSISSLSTSTGVVLTDKLSVLLLFLTALGFKTMLREIDFFWKAFLDW